MKYMKLGTKPDTFYIDEETRTVLSEVPTDIMIQIKNTKFLLHKFPLLLKCGLLQGLCSDADSSSSNGTPTSSRTIILHDFPATEETFELCAKFCYGVKIILSAHNFFSVFSAANLLQMTDSISQPNLLTKLHTFFNSFILPNWKDSVVALTHSDQTIVILIRKLINSVVTKILTHPSQVTWSFTYSRSPGRSVPKDWWTEDIADLHISHFQSVIFDIRSAKKALLPALIGEALHVYAVKNIPDQIFPSALNTRKDRRVLEAIVSMIPTEKGAVSCRFLMRLLKIASAVKASASVRAELVRRAGRQLDEVSSVSDLVFWREIDEGRRVLDVGIVEAVVESFLELGRNRMLEREKMRRAANVFDEYLGVVVADDKEMKLDKLVELVELMPEAAREDHNRLYRAIDIFLEEHPELSKAERKQLCKIIDCGKLSPEMRFHAIANDRLPLRTLVQLLFFEQEKTGGSADNRGTPPIRPSNEGSNVFEKNNQQRMLRERAEEQQQHHHRKEHLEGERNQERVALSSNYMMGGKKGEVSRSMPKPNLRARDVIEEKRKHQ